ncbi:MAG: PglZ domain-containing protein, partial [Candidatus Bipolaricaulota bacterium]|nr:PglZ domain-containing protein [Candidatus Bipolaricaulota bacterium]
IGDRVAEFLAYRIRQGTHRLALLVVDGLALDQWLVLRDEAGLEPLEESAIFACLPTLTPVARQALLSGRRPVHFPDTWKRTDAEERRWREFWAGEGLPPSAILYLRDPDPQTLEDALSDPRTRALAVVLTTVDRILHGMQLGTAGLHQQIRQWAGQGELIHIVGELRQA